MKYIPYFLFLLTVGCSSSKTIYDYDKQTNFSTYKTYQFFEDVGEGLNALDKKRVLHTIDNYLGNKGLKKAETPDFYIHVMLKELEREQRSIVSVSGLGVGNVAVGVLGGIPIGSTQIHQEITIDFVTANTNQLFWQGISTKKIKEKTTPKERDIYFKEIVTDILSGYPPKNKRLQ
ncbi:DUF4136 domain-containing protein [Tenacibaculum maritimum]|uniref:DUF4136 domain-containing protein n=1 Tax=Tenacibaculum maritimum NCIMB 2154 TaxID=1349785 RepID=A0A2H1ECH3_9FLAO|nr:DUF4136 domain-containing protein [Tenacibaculum maritimum]SFZ83962.1 conserved protein of unknown function [Tenacibaculum maritimum NCIMB 2154]